jgi:hypothetical protein
MRERTGATIAAPAACSASRRFTFTRFCHRELIAGANDLVAVEHDLDDLLALHHAMLLVGQRRDDLLRLRVHDLPGGRPHVLPSRLHVIQPGDRGP